MGEMNKIIEIVNSISNLDKLYQDVFNEIEYKKFTQLIWFNIKDDFDNIPTDSDLFFRVVVEKMIIVGIILKSETGYNTLKNDITELNDVIEIKSYEEISTYYKEFIEKVQKFLDENPDRRKNIV